MRKTDGDLGRCLNSEKLMLWCVYIICSVASIPWFFVERLAPANVVLVVVRGTGCYFLNGYQGFRLEIYVGSVHQWVLFPVMLQAVAYKGIYFFDENVIHAVPSYSSA